MEVKIKRLLFKFIWLASTVFTAKLVLERVHLLQAAYTEFEDERLANERALADCPKQSESLVTTQHCTQVRRRAQQSSLVSAVMVVVQRTYACGDRSCVDLMFDVLERLLVVVFSSWGVVLVFVFMIVFVLVFAQLAKPMDMMGTADWRAIYRYQRDRGGGGGNNMLRYVSPRVRPHHSDGDDGGN